MLLIDKNVFNPMTQILPPIATNSSSNHYNLVIAASTTVSKNAGGDLQLDFTTSNPRQKQKHASSTAKKAHVPLRQATNNHHMNT